MVVRAADEVAAALAGPAAAEILDARPDRPLLVDLAGAPPATGRGSLGGLRALVAVVVGIGRPADGNVDATGLVDVLVDTPAAAEEVAAAVARHPMAATSLALLLRSSEALAIDAAIVAESTTYSTLQAGPEHHRWLAERPSPSDRTSGRPDDGERVRTEQDGSQLRIALARPSKRNAVDAAMQVALADAFGTAADPAITEVVVSGDGPVFSTGGDLAEFGTLADPASAHLLRVQRSPGRALAAIAAKTTVHVHGACYGAGVELPAFAGRVVADPATTFTLPEVAMGLVPGAGGTVSIPRRIGRQRATWLAITGSTIDAETALAWGLVDRLSPAAATPG